jgi:hypothetical protein
VGGSQTRPYEALSETWWIIGCGGAHAHLYGGTVVDMVGGQSSMIGADEVRVGYFV